MIIDQARTLRTGTLLHHRLRDFAIFDATTLDTIDIAP